MKTIAFMGDSYTFHYALGEISTGMSPWKTQQLLRARGRNVQCRNFGCPGQTTGEMLARISEMVKYEIPTIGVIYAGANDSAYATTTASAASSTVFTVQSGLGAAYKQYTFALIDGQTVLITNVSTDTITVFPALSGGTPANGTVVAIDTTANIKAMGQYLAAAGCSRLLIGLKHYINLTSGGDTIDTPHAAGAALRVLQQAAATALNAPVADHYTHMRTRVVESASAATTVAASPAPTVLGFSVGADKGQYYAEGRGLLINSERVVVGSRNGDALTFETPLARIPLAGDTVVSPDTALSASWHVLGTNQHQNAYGSRIFAHVYDAAIAAQSGWLAALG